MEKKQQEMVTIRCSNQLYPTENLFPLQNIHSHLPTLKMLSQDSEDAIKAPNSLPHGFFSPLDFSKSQRGTETCGTQKVGRNLSKQTSNLSKTSHMCGYISSRNCSTSQQPMPATASSYLLLRWTGNIYAYCDAGGLY